MASLIRSSCWTRAPTYRAAAGTLARSDSTTGLRPATNSAASPDPRGARAEGPDGAAAPRAARAEGVAGSSSRRGPRDPAEAAARRWAGWPGRRAAGGVGPLPSSLRRPWPPVPGRGLPDLVRPEPGDPARPAPDRREPPEPPERVLTVSAPIAGLRGCPRPGCRFRPGRP